MNASIVALITGSTDGIGRETAAELARRGAHVILHGRSEERLAGARAAVEAAAPGARVETLRGDLGSLADVRRMAAEAAARWPSLDVLINNAGVYMKRLERTVDGHERSFAVNHLAPFVLTHLLLEPLGRARQGRVINVSSIAHQRGRVDFADLDGARHFDEYRAYALSKLANVLFTVELARRLGPGPVTVNALHPGVVSTKLLTEGFGMQGAESLAEGAATSVYLATAPEVTGVSGRYFVRCREAPMAPAAQDAALCRRFYEASAALCGITGVASPA